MRSECEALTVREEADMRSTEELDRREERPLWGRILGILEQDLARRRGAKLVVEVPDELGSYEEKEVGELSALEREGLPPTLKEYVDERLLDRYLAEVGYVDLIEKRHVYRKKLWDLTPADLAPLVEADRQRAEEKHQKEREARFVREARAGLEQLSVLELAEV